MSFLIAISGVMFAGAVVGALVSFPALLVLHFLMPKAVLERYWREPYFRPMELALFTDTIYAPMRTVMLAGAIAFPKLGRRRDVAQVRQLAPMGYRVAAYLFTVFILALPVLGCLGMVGLLVHEWIDGRTSPWKETIALLFAVACFGGVGVYQWLVRCREAKLEPKQRYHSVHR